MMKGMGSAALGRKTINWKQHRVHEGMQAAESWARDLSSDCTCKCKSGKHRSNLHFTLQEPIT
jgi:hypothetical protein